MRFQDYKKTSWYPTGIYVSHIGLMARYDHVHLLLLVAKAMESDARGCYAVGRFS